MPTALFRASWLSEVDYQPTTRWVRTGAFVLMYKNFLVIRMRFFLTAVLLLVSAFAIAQTPVARLKYGDHGSGRVLVIGTVTNNPKFNYGRMQGMAEYVLEHMRDLDVDSVEVYSVGTPEKMIRLLQDGRVDWVSATPFNAVRFADKGKGEFLLAKAQHGKMWYQTVFFSRADASINSLKDLLGKTIAFEKPSSTSAYFLPAAMLTAAGLPLVQLDSIRDKPPVDKIGYLFSGEESNATLWVHKRLVDAAVFSDADWQSDYSTPRALRDDLKIFERSRRLPRSVEVVRAGLPDEIKDRLKQVLMAAPGDPDAKAALNEYYRATAFVEINSEMLEAFDLIRQNMDSVALLPTP